MKICSFLPSGTEMVCSLGLEDSLVGVSHECDHPASVREKPVVVRPVNDLSGLSHAEIDRLVSESVAKGESLYRVDRDLLKKLQPDLVITQALCDVCAPAGREAREALGFLPKGSQVLYLTPHCLEDIFENIRSVGEAAGRLKEAQDLIFRLRERAVNVQTKAFPQKRKPKVFVLEWLDPPFSGGHWIPEMVSIAGGLPDPATLEAKSQRWTWERIEKFNPDILLYAPCGYHLPQAQKGLEALRAKLEGSSIEAVQRGQVYALDADSYLVRPGPRVVEGIELLAHIFYPRLFSWKGPKAFERAAWGKKTESVR